MKGRIGLQVSNVDLALPEPYIVGFAMPGVDRGSADPGSSFGISTLALPIIPHGLRGILGG